MSRRRDHNSDLSLLHEYNIDLTTNSIYLVGEEGVDTDGDTEPGVEYTMASRFIRNLNYLIHKDSGRPIQIHMKTCGGVWEEGIAIYDAILHCPAPVVILSYTHARSMSSLIFQAADYRVMMPHSTYMFHDGTMSYEGTVKQFLNEADQLKRTTQEMLDIYIDRLAECQLFAGSPRSKIKSWLRRQMDAKEDVYLTAGETLALNLTDAIVGDDGVTPYNLLAKMEGR